MKDFTPLGHAAVAVLIQIVVGAITGQWFVGGLLGCIWFLAREHTQAEYRWIGFFGGGKRAHMPWYGGFDPRVWDMPSVLDFLAPLMACIAVYCISLGWS